LLLNPAFRLQHLGFQGSINFQLSVRRSRAKVDQLSAFNSQLSTSSELLDHFLKLRTKDSSVVTIKRDMEPIPFLALDNESTWIS
jgi:hypothetical protein